MPQLFPFTKTSEIPCVIPIEEKMYQDSNYRAVIEGYNPILKEIEVYNSIITNTVTNTVYKNRQFGVGIHAGIGYAGSGFTPYIGVGVNCNLIGF